MKIVEPSYEILTPISPGGIEELQRIELAARTCYKSEGKIAKDGSSAKRLVKNLIANGHEAMLEHSSLSVKFVCDRGVSHELVRHRIASYAQESTRYCNYGKSSFGHEISVMRPRFGEDTEIYKLWKETCLVCEDTYFQMLEMGYSPQIARCVLPTCLKTEIVVTANYREWRNIFKLRCAKDAHPDIRTLMLPLLGTLWYEIPVVFDDLNSAYFFKEEDNGLDGIFARRIKKMVEGKGGDRDSEEA